MVGAMLWWLVTFWNTPPATLGEASFREAIRRHHTSASTRVVNDASLGPVPARVVAPTSPESAAGAPAAPADAPAPVPAESKAGPVTDAAWWQQRMTTAREAVARDRLLVAALDSRVAALANDIASRDDPEQRAQLMSARQQALVELDRLKKQVEEGLANIGTLQDEARKAGVPPGWVRN